MLNMLKGIKISQKNLYTKLYLGLFICALIGFFNVKNNYSITNYRVLTYGISQTNNNYFGQWVMHQNGWDRYLMYFSINSSIINGKPANTEQGNANTYNNRCGTWWADRIWLTWHFGDGKSLNGWNTNDGYGNVPPILMLDIGGVGESALIGDPSVVFWKNQWHMFYEGTDDCSGNNNRIFHATAPNFSGPWTKQGMVQGLWGNLNGSGLSWPTAFIDNDELYIFFTDGNIKLRAAKALNYYAHSFVMMNYDSTKPFNELTNPKPVSPDLINRGQVVKIGQSYKLIYDNFGRTQVKSSISNTPFNFPSGNVLFTTQNSTPAWENLRVGLPSILIVNGEQRIYYTGEGSQGTGIGLTILP